MSADENLQAHGANTHINYQSDFSVVLEYLFKGIHEKRKSVLNIIRTWDDVLFPNRDAKDGYVKVAQGTEKGEMQRALEMLKDDEIENEPDEDRPIEDEPANEE